MLQPTRARSARIPVLALLPFVVAAAPFLGARQDSDGWTGVLDEATFAALHELKKGAAPELLGDAVELGETTAYLSVPSSGEPLGGIVVIHEWWGLNDHVKHWADRLAADGYVALAVDLYGGKIATTRDEALAAMQGVDQEQALTTLRAAHAFLVEDKRAQVERTACIGWCFGGGWSLKLALAEPELDAAVLYYGRLVDDPDVLEAIEAPVLGVFGNEDSGIPPSAVDAFRDAMEEAGKDLTLARYDAEHAFANPSSARYDAENAALAWRETRAFLCRELWPEQDSGDLYDGSRALEYDAPESWRLEEPRTMRVVSFQLGGGTECYVSALRGDAGGTEANLSRWSNQFGGDGLDSDEIEQLPTLPILGKLAPILRVEGTFTDMRGNTLEDAAMLGTICVLDDEVLFVKMVGSTASVDGSVSEFATFCRSLR